MQISLKYHNKFYAHSTDRQDRSDWQLLDNHLTSVAKLAADFAEIFNAVLSRKLNFKIFRSNVSLKI